MNLRGPLSCGFVFSSRGGLVSDLRRTCFIIGLTGTQSALNLSLMILTPKPRSKLISTAMSRPNTDGIPSFSVLDTQSLFTRGQSSLLQSPCCCVLRSSQRTPGWASLGNHEHRGRFPSVVLLCGVVALELRQDTQPVVNPPVDSEKHLPHPSLDS